MARAFKTRWFSDKMTCIITFENGTEIRHTPEDSEHHLAIGYYRKQNSLWFNYRFRSYQEMKEFVDYKKKLVLEREKDEQELKENRKKIKEEIFKIENHYQVGDIIVNSWGYEQTNVEFYQVTRVLNMTIEVREILQKVEEGSYYSHGMACNVLPRKDDFIEKAEPFLLYVKVYPVENPKEGELPYWHSLSGKRSFYSFRKWSGNSQYNSWYA